MLKRKLAERDLVDGRESAVSFFRHCMSRIVFVPDMPMQRGLFYSEALCSTCHLL